MGAQESRAQGSKGESVDAVDYYSILEISEDATQDEIKKAFRKQALIHHPDKNHTDAEGATERFARIQQAYEVLSDEQERAWYDSHRASLVPEADAGVVLEEVRTGKSQPRGRDRGLTTMHLMKFLDPSNWSSFDDSDKGFFALYRNLFLRLAQEEEKWGSDLLFPSFGYSTWSWIATKDQEDGAVRTFYNQWLSFSTVKDFSWTEQWNVNEAPERRVRRLMEKENKKRRDDAKREYNETVRSLVLFIRKRDPRYKLHMSRTAVSTSSGGDQSGASTAARKREQAGQSYVEQEWQRVNVEDLDKELESEEAGQEEEWECVACGNTFRSEAAWESHERSRKHMKEVERLRQEMRHENDLLDLNGTEHVPSTPDPEFKEPPANRVDSGETDEAIPSDDEFVGNNDAESTEPLPAKSSEQRSRKNATTNIDENLLTRRRTKIKQIVPELESSLEDSDTLVTVQTIDRNDPPQISKREKRRTREAAKKARERGDTVPRETCNVCYEEFESRTKLFAHINSTGHALAQPEDGRLRNLSKSQNGRKAKVKRSS